MPGTRLNRFRDSLQWALCWLVVGAVGLAPTLVYWVAGVIARAFRRKRGGGRTNGRPLEAIVEERHHRARRFPVPMIIAMPPAFRRRRQSWVQVERHWYPTEECGCDRGGR